MILNSTRLQTSEINSLRGLACLLLVFYHVVGGSPSQGLQLTDGVLRGTNDVLAYIRMPLFTLLSGYVYSLKPIGNFSPVNFLKLKARRLLLPMLTVGTLFALVRSVSSFSNTRAENIFLIHIIPVAHFWFVEALFLIFVLIVFLEGYGFLSDLRKFSFVFFSAIGVYLYCVPPIYFGVAGAVYLLPYFLVGLFLGRYSICFNVVFSRIFIFFIVLWLSWAVLLNGAAVERMSPLALSSGILVCIFFVGLKLNNKYLAYLGSYSYAIYLYHVFFSAAARVSLNYFTNSVFLHLIIGCSLAFLGPIVIEAVFVKNKYLACFFLGKRVKPDGR